MKIFAWSAATAAICVCAFLAGCAAQPRTPQPPGLQLTLKPHATGGKVDQLDVTLRIEKPNVAAGGKLVQMALVVVSIPTVRYDGAAISAQDERGELVLTAADQPPTSSMTMRHWTVNRATVGDVIVRARAVPREVSSSTRNGPLFDLRDEAGSVYGAGLAFLPLPDSKNPFRIRLQWDLAGMPAGSSGVWSLGEGDVDTVDTVETLSYSFYAAGPMGRHPAAGDSKFTMYWFSKPPFDAAAVGTGIESFFEFAARFFKDPGGSYRVFIRRNPYPAGGGTALRRSFMFGWGTGRAQTSDELQGLLAHEITHNWPRLDDAEHGDIAWYSEGTAEYYSILLSRRAGAIDDTQFLKRINDRASGYYTNPYRVLSNAEAAKKFWVDPRAQRVPYGRGFMYLAQLDAKLRAASAGARRVDDLVLEVLGRQRKGEAVGLKQWEEMVTRELGPSGKEDLDAMIAGQRIVPPADGLGPCLRLEPHRERPLELGFDAMRPTVVTNLIAGSNAALAGLREGDTILERTDSAILNADETAEMVLTVRRGDEQLEIRYLPRSAPVDSYRWVRTETPLAGCRY